MSMLPHRCLLEARSADAELEPVHGASPVCCHSHPQVLDLCSDDELESIYELLYAPSPFSPVVKSLVAESEPALLGLRGRVRSRGKAVHASTHSTMDASARTCLGCMPGWAGKGEGKGFRFGFLPA